MKTLIFSDTHLTDKFDEKKYNFLIRIISAADKVIINGDFWDNWFTDFDSFVTSKWAGLFPLLLEKETIYIFGNHDPKDSTNDKVKLFSVENTSNFTFSSDNIIFTVTHGNTLLRDKRPAFLKAYGKILDKTNGTLIGNALHKIIHILEQIGFSVFGAEYMTDTEISKRNNLLIKSHGQNLGHWLVCGDTHCSEIDRSSLFANSGSIGYGLGSYLMVENGEINLFKECY